MTSCFPSHSRTTLGPQKPGQVSSVFVAILFRRRVNAQLERRYSEHNVDGDRALDGERLKRDGAVGTAEQDIGASAEANANIAGNADIFAGKRPGGHAGGPRKHGPAQHATGANADVNGALVDLGRDRRVWDEKALHGLVA